MNRHLFAIAIACLVGCSPVRGRDAHIPSVVTPEQIHCERGWNPPLIETRVVEDAWSVLPSVHDRLSKRGNLLGSTCIGRGCNGGSNFSGITGGDVSCTSGGNCTVNSISGATPITVTPNVLQWKSSTTTPTISIATPTSDVATVPILIQGEAPFASASTNKSTGSISLNFPTPVAGANATTGNGGVNFYANGGLVGSILVTTGTGLGTVLTYYEGSTTPSSTNYFFAGAGGDNFFNATTEFGIGLGGTLASLFDGQSGNISLFGRSFSFGGGTGVLEVTNASTAPSSNPTTSGLLYSASGAGVWRGSSGATTTMSPTGSNGTINSQHQILDQFVGTAETVSSASATSLGTYTTKNATGAQVTCQLTSRATTAGTCGIIGDTSASTYVFSYRNPAGTVALSTAGPTLITGTNQTTAAALGAPVLTVTVATNVLTFNVTNVALCTIDSQVACQFLVD